MSGCGAEVGESFCEIFVIENSRVSHPSMASSSTFEVLVLRGDASHFLSQPSHLIDRLLRTIQLNDLLRLSHSTFILLQLSLYIRLLSLRHEIRPLPPCLLGFSRYRGINA